MSSDKKILMIDDSDDQIIFMSRILEDNGYTFNIARNGNEALASIKQEKPALVLLDIMMPGKTGLNVLRFMKGDDQLKSIPVIIVSGAGEITGVSIKTGELEGSNPVDDIVARRFGEVIHETLKDLKPSGVVEKPVDPDLLVKKIKELFPA